MNKIAIIGAGLAGLTAAKILARNAELRVFEKSWRAGGRMSNRTRHYDFDHGAQYFTARSKAFREFLAPFIERGMVARWDARFAELDRSVSSNRRTWSADYPHYVGVPGMNAVCLALGQDLDVQYETRVTAISPAGTQWELTANDNLSLGRFDWVVSALPVQQAAALMPGKFSAIEQIRRRKMQGCYTLMLGFEHPLELDFDCAHVRHADLSWIAVNSSKPGRPSGFTLIAHSTNPWADENMELPDDEVIDHLTRELCDVLDRDIRHAAHTAMHRWRYANIEKQTGEQALIDWNHQLAAIGDWCIQGRVESAFTSASRIKDIGIE